MLTIQNEKIIFIKRRKIEYLYGIIYIGGERMFVGVIIIIVGLLFFMEAIIPGFAVEFQIVWPVVLFILALYFMLKKRRIDAFSSFLMVASIWYLLYHFGVIAIQLSEVFIPLLLVFIGLSIIFNAVVYKADGKHVRARVTNKGDINYYGIFSAIEEKIKSKDFKGANIFAIFGGVDLDLREMQVKKDTVIEGYAIFGGIDLLVSDDYNVIVKGSAFFGGNENKSMNTYDEKRPTLYIHCLSVFGGMTIK